MIVERLPSERQERPNLKVKAANSGVPFNARRDSVRRISSARLRGIKWCIQDWNKGYIATWIVRRHGCGKMLSLFESLFLALAKYRGAAQTDAVYFSSRYSPGTSSSGTSWVRTSFSSTRPRFRNLHAPHSIKAQTCTPAAKLLRSDWQVTNLLFQKRLE